MERGGSPTTTSKGEELFREQLESSDLPALLRPYDGVSRVRAMLELPGRGIISGLENYITASAIIESGSTKEIPEEVLLQAVRESDRLTLRVPPADGWLIGHLRTVRGLRPAWYSGPIYAELLEPFSQQIREITGLTPSGVFELLLKVAELPHGASPPPAELEGLPDSLLLRYERIKEPSDFRDRAFLRVENWVYPLGYQMADATYRALCAELRDRLPKFLDLKGDSLETGTRSRLERHASAWRWFPNFAIQAEPKREHDFIGFREEYGVAGECKSLNLRPSSMDWSARNVISDIQPILDALSQIQPSLELLRRGGEIVARGEPRRVPRVNWVRGLIVTDEVFTPYLRESLDRPAREDSLESRADQWHGSTTYVLSIMDLEFLLESSGLFSVFLEFSDWMAKRPRFRGVDTPEAWLFYCIDPMIRISMDGGYLTAEYGELWEKVRTHPLSALRPPWLSSHAEIAQAEKEGRYARAISLIRRDREVARRHFPTALQMESMTQFWKENLELTRREHWRIRLRTRGSPPLGD